MRPSGIGVLLYTAVIAIESPRRQLGAARSQERCREVRCTRWVSLRLGQGSPRFCYTCAPSLPSRRACELLVVEPPLVFLWRPVADGRVPPLLVVKPLDVVERQVLAAADRLEALPELELEGREPALHRSV